MTLQPDAPSERPNRHRILAAMAARMANADVFGTGPLAELRRLNPAGALGEPALHRLLARFDVWESDLADDGLARWALVIHACALAAPRNFAFPGRDSKPEPPEERAGFWAEESRRALRSLGREAFEAGYSERRFVTLLDAGPHELQVNLPRAVRFLVAHGRKLPVLAMLDLVMTADDADEDRGRAVRRRIARGYYRAEAAAEKPEARTPPGDAA